MNIIGWVRLGDATSCGGAVSEGLPFVKSRGTPIAFQGARIACRHNCVIADGFDRASLPNGHKRVIHGMKSSQGCPIYSTLNDIDGVGNERGATIPLTFIQDHDGQWIGDTTAEQTGKRFLVKNSDTGEPLANRAFLVDINGERLKGTTDAEGYAYVDAKPGDSIKLHVIFEAPAGILLPEGESNAS